MANRTSLKVELFGGLRVWRGGELIEGEQWGGWKTRSLFKLLLTRPVRALSRDEIMDALWPESSPTAAEQRLRTTVSLLRRALEPGLARGADSRYILLRPPGYLFDRDSGCEVDLWEFEERQRRAETAREAGSLEEAIREYRLALDPVCGDLLAEEPYAEWAIEAREEFRQRHLSILSGLSECLARKGLYSEAIDSCDRALMIDGYSEDLHRRLMLYHYCAGEQAAALRTYRDYAGNLTGQLGAVPSPDLARLRERIEARDVPGVDEGRRLYPRPRRLLRFPYSLGRTYFVGRDGELALLAERLEEAMAGRGGAVAVEGEAGVGKTRLVEEFLGYARSRGARTLTGRCYERELGAPLEPVLDALGPVADTDGIVSGASRSGTEDFDLPEQAGAQDGARVYRALAAEVVRQSQDGGHRALALFVDDLQWADPATLEFLSYLARRISGERVLLVFAYRREDAPELSGWLARLAERRDVATLNLNRLLSQDVARILSRTSSRGFAELPRLADFLHRESEGNPFYAVEYLRWLIENGVVRIDSRRRISGLRAGMLREGALPSGVRSLIQARLARLDEEARTLLELAAVIGRDFDLELLRRADGREESGTLGTIGALTASGLVVETSEQTYHLSHDKLRQVLYEGIEGPRRRTLHLRVAGTLERAGGEPAEVAHHYLQTKEWGSALENLVLAAKKAEKSYAWEGALESYARALEVMDRLPDSLRRRLDLLAARERLLERMDRREERVSTVRQMLGLAQRLGDQGRVAEVHLRRVGALAAVSNPKGAAKAAQTAVAVFQELGNSAGEARVHREVGHVCLMERDYAGVLEANLRALRIHRELDDRRGEVGDIHNISQAYCGLGDYDQALRWVEEADRVRREPGEDYWAEMLRNYTMTSLHLDRGDLEAALRASLEGIQLDARFGRDNASIPGHSRCGTLYLRLWRPEKALEHFREAARLNREAGHTRDEGYSLMSVGACLEQTADPTGAANAYRRAVKLLDIAYEESVLAEDLSGKADAESLLAAVLHRSLDRPEEALSLYESAAGTHRELGNEPRLRGVLLELAGLRWRTGEPEASAHDYEEALELSREHKETAHEAAALASLSVVYRELGFLRESLRRGRAARDLLREPEDLQTEAYVLTSLADSYASLGHYPSALSCLKRSIRLRREVGDKEGEAGALRDLAGVYEKLGDADRARASAEEADRSAGAQRPPFGAERSK